jgi:4-nitrophenyl phosphatase
MPKVTAENVTEVFDGIKYVLLDCDGVLWNGDHVFDGIPEAIQRIRDSGREVRFITNNTTMSRAEMVKNKFSKLQCGVESHEVLSAAYATMMALRSYADDADRGFDKGNVLVLGNPGLHAELQKGLAPGRYTYGLELREDHGESILTTRRAYDMRLAVTAWDTAVLPAPVSLRTVTRAAVTLQELDIAAVVIGFDFCYNLTMLALVTMVLQRHERVQGQSKALFIATNDDPTISLGELGWTLPGCGTIVSPVKVASDREPDVTVGKPSKALFDLLIRDERERGHDVKPEQCLMVGDRLTTDIYFGRRAGARTLFVLSGIEQESDVPSEEAAAKHQDTALLVPHYVADSLADAMALLSATK